MNIKSKYYLSKFDENLSLKKGYFELLKESQKKQLSKTTLKECLVDIPKGIFVKVLPITDSTVKIRAKLAPLETNEKRIQDDLHCTVIYSSYPKANVELPHVSKNERFYALGTHLEYWPNNEGNIVLCLQSAQLNALNKKFVDAGIEANFKDYKAHVTIIHPVENFDRETFDLVNKKLAEYPLELEFYYGGYVLIDDQGI